MVQFCQSCGMPLNEEVLGTEKDGAKSQDYCSYCYDKGQFATEMTMKEMIELCVPTMASSNENMTEAQAREMMKQFFPTLKRWAK